MWLHDLILVSRFRSPPASEAALYDDTEAMVADPAGQEPDMDAVVLSSNDVPSVAVAVSQDTALQPPSSTTQYTTLGNATVSPFGMDVETAWSDSNYQIHTNDVGHHLSEIAFEILSHIRVQWLRHYAATPRMFFLHPLLLPDGDIDKR